MNGKDEIDVVHHTVCKVLMFCIERPDCCADVTLSAAFAGLDPVSVVRSLRGDIDVDDAVHLAHLVRGVLQSGAVTRLVVDLARVTFLGVCGISALIDAHADAAAFGCRLVLVRPGPVVHRMLEITGLLELFALPMDAPQQPAQSR